MAKAVTLKNNNDEEVYPVTDLSLVNGNIPTGRIADGAVTSSKIDWTTYTPVWTTYDIRDIYTDVTSLQLKTRLGRPFTAKVINNSTGVVIENLDSSIRLVRVTLISRFANNTNNIGINGVAPNSKVWTYCVGENNGAAVNVGSGNEVGNSTYANALTGTWNGNKNALSATYTATALDADVSTLTVIVAVELNSLLSTIVLTVIVVFPPLKGVTTPDESIVATLVLLDVQVKVLTKSAESG